MAVGGEFYPLVVETYGFWTPASLQTLKLTFSRVSAVTIYSFSQMQKNLMQQLSIKLWMYNARMIYHRLLVDTVEVFRWIYLQIAIIWFNNKRVRRGARKEQRCGNNNRLGDVFHPNFSMDTQPISM